MRHTHRKAGFSLMEVNMAVFVMAVGILSLVALFPLGLRESVQGKQDLQQSMFADFALNQMVAALSQTNLTWTEWVSMDGAELGAKNVGSIPDKVKKQLDLLGDWTVNGEKMEAKHYRLYCDLVDESSSRIMGIGVRSTDIDVSRYEMYTNNVLYYAEALFQGDPSK